MDVIFYKASFEEGKESEISEISVSDRLFERLARTGFSEIGEAKDTTVNIDGEMTETHLVTLSPIIRKCALMYLNELMNIVSREMIAAGIDIPRKKYTEYFYDIKSLAELIDLITNDDFTHFARSS